MKTKVTSFYCLLIIILLVFVQCRKDSGKINPLEGTWELKYEIGGTTGNKTEYEPNNGNLIIFSKANYQILSGYPMIKSGSFKVIREPRIVTNTEGNRIIFDNEPEQIRTFFNIKDNILELYVDAFDGLTTVYIRKL